MNDYDELREDLSEVSKDLCATVQDTMNIRDDLTNLELRVSYLVNNLKDEVYSLEGDVAASINVLEDKLSKIAELADDIQYMNGRDMELSALLKEYDQKMNDVKKMNDALRMEIAGEIYLRKTEQAAATDIILRGAKYEALYNQVLDAVGFSSEAVGSGVVTHEELLELLKDAMEF